MNRTTRLSAIAILGGLCALSLTACGTTGTPAPVSVPVSAKTAAPPATGSGGQGDSLGGSGTLTTDVGTVYHFTTVACLGQKSPSGKLTMTATTDNPDTGATAIIGFDGAGKFTVALTVNGSDLWTGEGAAGTTGSRTVDTVKFTAVPISGMTGGDSKLTGTLTCSGTQALF